MTLLSRVTGLLQSMFLAHFLGAGPAADAFAVAFRLPNLFRRFTAEGTMSAAFLPTLTEAEAAEGHEAAVRTGIFFLGTLMLFSVIIVSAFQMNFWLSNTLLLVYIGLIGYSERALLKRLVKAKAS